MVGSSLFYLLWFGCIPPTSFLALPKAQEGTHPQSDPLPENAVLCLGSRSWRHAAEVVSVALSRDGRLALSGSADRTMALWDTRTGARLRTFGDHPAGLSAVAFTSDNKRAVSASWTMMALWDVATGKRLKVYPCTAERDQIEAMAISPDDRRILWGTLGGTLVITDLESGRAEGAFEESSDRVSCVAWSADGKLALSGTCNGSQPSENRIHLWDTQNRTRVRSFQGHSWEITRVRFTKDDLHVLSSSRDYSVTLWDVKTGTREKKIVQPGSAGSPSRALALSPDEKTLLSSDNNGNLLYREMASGNTLKTFETGYVLDAVFSGDGKHALLGLFDHTLALWDLQTGKPVTPRPPHVKEVSIAHFSPDGTKVLTGGGDKTLLLWDSRSGTRLRSMEGHSERVESVAFGRGGRSFVSGSIDGSMILWDTESGQIIRKLEGGPGEAFWHISPFSDGRRALVAASSAVTIWDLVSGIRLGDLKATEENRPTLATAISPDGRQGLLAGADGLSLWDLEKRSKVRPLVTPTSLDPSEWVTSVAFSPDASRALAGMNDKRVLLLDPNKGAVIHSMPEERDWVVVTYSPDGCWAASGSVSGTVNLWDLGTGKRVISLIGHLGRIRSVEFSPSGRRLVSASEDTTAIVWQPMIEESKRAEIWAAQWKALNDGDRAALLKSQCEDLASQDFAKMTVARERLMALGKEGVAGVLQAFPPEPIARLTAEQVRQLDNAIERLDADNTAQRTQAQEEIEGLGVVVLDRIETKLQQETGLTPECRQRLKSVLGRLCKYSPRIGDVGRVRAVLMLIETPLAEGVHGALAVYAKGPANSYATVLARRALEFTAGSK